MVQNRSSVKLFGNTIELLVPAAAAAAAADDDDDKEVRNIPDRRRPNYETHDDVESFASEESSKTRGITGEDRTTEAAEEDGSLTPTVRVVNQDNSREKGQEVASNSHDRTLEKPDKILPCPRCNSADTKFCYYNNYSVNQPRYFCRDCQRYWTAGGSMRNVPVGAGRRKSKSSANFRYHDISVTSPSAKVPAVQHEDPCQTSSVVLSFGNNLVLCEPSPTTMKLNYRARSKVDDLSCGSFFPASNNGEDTDSMQKLQQYSIRPPCIYPWNPSSPATSPVFSTAPIQGSCIIPWQQPYQIAPPTTIRSTAPTAKYLLGKRSRDGYILKHGSRLDKESDKKSVWSPRNLRIDDPGEAAKSSISLTVPNGSGNGFGSGELFKAFYAKEMTSSMIVHPNPAAMSRSMTFRESM